MAAPLAEQYKKIWLRFFFYLGFYFGGYVAEDFHGDGIFAEGFDGFAELDLALVDLEALGGEGFGDVAGGDGAEELVVFAGFISVPVAVLAGWVR